MNGFIEAPNRGRRFPYTFEDQTLTVYGTNSLPLDMPTDLGVLSNNNFLIASVTGKSSLAVFFVDELPFGDTGPIIWTSTTLRVFYYIDKVSADHPFVPDKMYLPLMNSTISLTSILE